MLQEDDARIGKALWRHDAIAKMPPNKAPIIFGPLIAHDTTHRLLGAPIACLDEPRLERYALLAAMMTIDDFRCRA